MRDYRFRDTEILKNFSLYETMRVNFEILLIFSLSKYFNFKEILEIGFRQGMTFGALLEAINQGSLTAIDLDFDMSLYDKFYKDSVYVKNNNVNLLKMSSLDFNDVDRKYDFINVDGDHTMPVVYKDLLKSVKLIKHSGILMIDDYYLTDIDFAINKLLETNSGFVPFLMDEQAVFFHHVSHDASHYLDVELKEIFSMFCDVSDIEYKSHQVKKISALPAVTNHNDIFSLICEKYKL